MTAGVPVEMARANLGITVVPRWTVEPALGQGDLHAVRMGRRGLWHQWAMVTRAEAPSPSLARFLAALKTHHPRARRKAS
jgi:LysR family transcriptional regulator for metE and metH